MKDSFHEQTKQKKDWKINVIILIFIINLSNGLTIFYVIALQWVQGWGRTTKIINITSSQKQKVGFGTCNFTLVFLTFLDLTYSSTQLYLRLSLIILRSFLKEPHLIKNKKSKEARDSKAPSYHPGYLLNTGQLFFLESSTRHPQGISTQTVKYVLSFPMKAGYNFWW